MKTARVHRAARRRGGGVAARGARAASASMRRSACCAGSRKRPGRQARVAAFRQGCRAGMAEGRNMRIDYRWGAADADRLREYAAEWSRSPDVIVAESTPACGSCCRRRAPCHRFRIGRRSGRQRIRREPAQAGGNVTGFTNFEYDGREMAGAAQGDRASRETVPSLLQSRLHPFRPVLKTIEAAAPSLGVNDASPRARADRDRERRPDLRARRMAGSS